MSKKSRPGVEVQQSGKPRFDALPSRAQYLDADPASRFRSIFQQTEEGIAAEHAERIEGAIDAWHSKLVVADPVLRMSMRARDTPAAQADRYKGLLHDAPATGSLRRLYRGSKPLSLSGHKLSEPSIFIVR